MKKMMIGIVTLGMCLAVLTGCTMIRPGEETDTPTPGGKTGLELVGEMCEKLPEAKKIVQTIEIRAAGGTNILQYESEKTFVKGTDGYTVTGKEKQLNELGVGGEDAYTETAVSDTLTIGKYSVQLDLNEIYFSPAPSYKDGVLTGKVRDQSVESLLGLGEHLPAAPHGMELTVTTKNEHVTGIAIEYTSASSTVGIMLLFTY